MEAHQHVSENPQYQWVNSTTTALKYVHFLNNN